MLTVNYNQSKQCNFSIVRGKTTGIYWFFDGILRVGRYANEFQRVKDSPLKDIPFTNCYIDEHKAILLKILNILASKNMAVK